MKKDFFGMTFPLVILCFGLYHKDLEGSMCGSEGLGLPD